MRRGDLPRIGGPPRDGCRGRPLARAKAAVASRYGAVIRQETELLNADAKLRTLMNDPYLLQNRGQELIPMQPPLHDPLPLSFEDSLVVALNHRPEINEARTELKAAAIRQDVAKNELRPALNLILSTYVSGIEGDVSTGTSASRSAINSTRGVPRTRPARPSRCRWETAPPVQV